MADDFEKIDLTLPTSEYALVIFHNTQEFYQTDSDIECAYTITPSLEPSNRDWVGVYKVGWRSARDYVCFDWSVIPPGYEQGQRAEVAVSFKATNLPKDDGEFYQFCYVTNTGHIRGASTPFQFRRPGSDDYVEVEDEEDEDILVIKSKTAMLEDSLSKAEKEKEELSKTIEYLEKEKESLLGNLIVLEKALQKETEEHDITKRAAKEAMRNLEGQREEKEELRLLHHSVKEKVTVLNQEKDTWVKRLDDNDAYIKSLQEKIKMLINEKDALTGQNKVLEEEKELYKCHFTSSEDQVKGYLVELETLRRKVKDEEQTSTELNEKVAALTSDLKLEHEVVEGCKEVNECNKVQISELEEKLKNSEDKLEAAEHCKTLLNTEVSTLKQTFEKLSLDLEQSKSDTHSYKSQLNKNNDLIQEHTEKVVALQRTLQMKEQELKDCQQECVKVKQMVEEQKLHQRVEEEGPLYALKLAYNSLSDRFEKVKHTKEEMHGQMEDALAKVKTLEQEKQQVEEECRKRLRLAQEEYEKRVIECHRLQSELRRALRTNRESRASGCETETLRRRSASTSSADQEGAASSAVKSATEELCAGSSPGCAESPPADTAELTEVVIGSENISLMEQTTSELQGQLDHLGQELEKRQTKKNKYKKLYQDEKEKRAYLEKHYFTELKKKDEEINRLNTDLEELRQDRAERIHTFEGLLEEQKIQMEQERHSPAAGQGAPMYPVQTPGYPMPPFMATAHPQHVQPFYPPQQPPMPVNPPQPMAPLPQPMNPTQQPPQHYVLTNASYPSQPDNVANPPIPPRSCQPPPPLANMDSPAPALPERVHADCEIAGLDPLNDPDTPTNLDPPLTPLPPPLSPQRSITAMIVEVKAINGDMAQSNQVPADTHIDMRGPTEEEEEEDRFHDAEEGPTQEVNEAVARPPPSVLDSMTGLSLRTCPVCEMVFTPQTLERDIYRHVESHLGQTCPMCSQIFDETTSPQEYATHVQSHFNDE